MGKSTPEPATADMTPELIANREEIFNLSYSTPDCPVHILAKAMVDAESCAVRDFLYRAILHLNDYLDEDNNLDWYC